MATIAIAHIGLEGHLAPGMRLGETLVRQGHEVHCWAPPAQKARLEATGATFHPFEPAPVSAISGGPPGFAATLTEAVETHLEELAAELLANDADLVVHDTEAPWGMAAAEFLGLPRLVSHTAFPGPSSHRKGRRELVPAFPPGSNDALARAARSRDAIMRNWGIDVGDLLAQPPAAVPTVAYTTSEIAGLAEPRDDWWFIGPLLDRGPERDAAAPRPLVYVSLGTFFNFVGPVYRSIIDALASEPLDVVISTGRGPVAPSDLDGLAPNVMAHEFVDARELLARADVMITHCGASSVHEALIAGVPMVCMPQALDQFAWADRVQDLGAGLITEENAPAIWGAVTGLLEDSGPRDRARALGDALTSYDGDGAVATAVAQTLSRGSARPLPEPDGPEVATANADIQADRRGS